MKKYYVYILTNKFRTVFYIGVTGNIEQRIYQHKNKLIEGFTQKYNVDELVYVEETTDIESAIKREKQIKKWNRDWKIKLIKSQNPEMKNLLID